MITILIPTRNEKDNIKTALVKTADALVKSGRDYEILVIDDASNDGTVGIVEKEAQKNGNIRLVRREPPYGFGNSLRDGINMARGEYCVILMADLSDDPGLIPRMADEMDKGVDMVIGSRFVSGAKISRYPALKMASNRAFNLALQVGLLSSVSDSSNAFKMFRTSMAREMRLESAGFEISAELTSKFIIRKAKIEEMPASWADREGGEAKFKLGKESSRYFRLYLRMLHEKYLGKKN